MDIVEHVHMFGPYFELNIGLIRLMFNYTKPLRIITHILLLTYASCLKLRLSWLVDRIPPTVMNSFKHSNGWVYPSH